MPEDTGMAFVLVSHMARGHDSALPEILARRTRMPVQIAADGVHVEPDHIYVCPADRTLTMEGLKLSLATRTSNQQQKPIDVFLGSLAEQLAEDAVGVVLSGSGSDGALGIKAVKEHGGLTVAQGSDGTAPRQSSMPQSAIATGFVDITLPVEEIATRLAEFARMHRDLDEPGEPAPQAETEEDAIEARRTIARILHAQVGHDFFGYKEKTFMRRVRRRMQIVQVDKLSDYIERLRQEPDEVTLLFRDLLIGVTTFFRDKEAFEALQQLVVPKLFENVGAADTIRIWVPGCATGEEVYSIAIL